MIPYYEFLDAGMTVDISSIEGGAILFEPISLKYPFRSHADNRYLGDEDAIKKTENSLKIDDVDFTEYDIIYMAGGWGVAYEKDGKPLVEGKNMTAVTNKQVEELGISITPLHPERELRALGANFKSNTGFKDVFQTLVVIDSNIVTGQNQNSSGATAQAMLKILEEKSIGRIEKNR